MSASDRRGPTLAIVTALPEEFGPIRAIQRERRVERSGGRTVSIGRIGAWRSALVEGGEGLSHARESARFMLDFARPSALIGAGVAGGISPGLEVGEVLAGGRVAGPGPAAIPGDFGWLARARRAGAREGLLVTAAELFVTVAAKSSLWRSFDCADPAAVDLESFGWAQAAAEERVPFLALRGVADRAHDELPALLLRCRDSSGATDRKLVALQAIRHPGSIAGLVSLARKTRRASIRLAGVIERLLSDAAP